MCTPTLFIYDVTGCQVSLHFCFIHTCCQAKKGSSDVSQSLVLEWWTRDLPVILRIIVFNDTGECRKRNGIQFLANRNWYESVNARMWEYFNTFFLKHLLSCRAWSWSLDAAGSGTLGESQVGCNTTQCRFQLHFSSFNCPDKKCWNCIITFLWLDITYCNLLSWCSLCTVFAIVVAVWGLNKLWLIYSH